jgi:hypothetical protein
LLANGYGFHVADAVQHYTQHGYYEGRATTAFDGYEYIASNSDLLANKYGFHVADAVQHYTQHGYHEGRTINSFDAVAYLLSNPDLQNGSYDARNALIQYTQTGYTQGRPTAGAFGSEQTNHTIALGGSASDALATSGDKDWFRVNLSAGQAYTFNLSGADSSNGTLADPLLQLYNGAGQLVAQDDNSGPGNDSLLHMTAATTGTFYLVASASGSQTGTYKLFAATG